MGAAGEATLDFGAFPGGSDASVAVTGQAGIVAGSKVEAWILPKATADHTDTEHMIETIRVFAASIVAGTGFTVFGFNDTQLNEPSPPIAPHELAMAYNSANPWLSIRQVSAGVPPPGGLGSRIYGQWNVGWVWS